MTVCQFFLQGRCRFGQNCRFEHIYNNEDRKNQNVVNSQQLSDVVKQVVEEVISAEKGGQWPLSCFSPVKDGPNIPGWEDVSPEEVRWKMYEARANGTLNQCTQEINQLYRNAEKMRNIIKEPTMERVNLIVNALKDKLEPTNSSTQFQSSSSIFRGSVQSAANQNIFRNVTSSRSHGSIFGNSSPTSGNIFGGSTSFTNQNIFGGSNTSNTFSQNAFSNQQTTCQNIFSNPSLLGSGNIFSSGTVSSQNIFSKPDGEKNNQNAFLTPNSKVFSNQTSNSPMFGSNNTFFQKTENQNQNQSTIFDTIQSENIFKTQNAFGKTNNIFNTQEASKSIFENASQKNSFSSNHQTSIEFDSSVYSKIENLSDDEIKSFTSATFACGKIPLKPPPKEYCK